MKHRLNTQQASITIMLCLESILANHTPIYFQWNNAFCVGCPYCFLLKNHTSMTQIWIVDPDNSCKSIQVVSWSKTIYVMTYCFQHLVDALAKSPASFRIHQSPAFNIKFFVNTWRVHSPFPSLTMLFLAALLLLIILSSSPAAAFITSWINAAPIKTFQFNMSTKTWSTSMHPNNHPIFHLLHQYWWMR